MSKFMNFLRGVEDHNVDFSLTYHLNEVTGEISDSTVSWKCNHGSTGDLDPTAAGIVTWLDENNLFDPDLIPEAKCQVDTACPHVDHR